MTACDRKTCNMVLQDRLRRLDRRTLGPAEQRMSAKAGAWMNLSIGILALVGALLDIIALATGGDLVLGVLSLVIAAAIAVSFTRRGLTRLRAE